MKKDLHDSLLAYCGVDCSKCDCFTATQKNDIPTLEIIAKHLGIKLNQKVLIDNILCDGCNANGRICFICGNDCKIRQCAQDNNHQTCATCKDFACDDLKNIFIKKPKAEKTLLALKNKIKLQ